MALMAVMVGTGLTSSASHPYGIFIDGLDVAKGAGTAGSLVGVDVDSVEVNETLGQPTAMTFVIDDPTVALSIRKNADVYFCDHHGRQSAAGAWLTGDLFRGYITSLVQRPVPSGGGTTWEVTAVGLEGILDRRVLTGGVFPSGMSVMAALQQLLGQCDPRISALQTDLGALSVARWTSPNLMKNTSSPTLTTAVAVAGKTYRQAADAIVAASSAAVLYSSAGTGQDVVDVDVQGRVRFLPLNGITPFSLIKEGTGALAGIYATRPAPARITADTDTSKLVNAVYVRGVDASASGWVLDNDSIGTYGRIEAFLDAPQAVSSTTRDAIGTTYLAQHRVISRLEFTLSSEHDDFVPTPADDTNYVSWNARAQTGLSSSTGLWAATDMILHSITTTYSGGGAHLEMKLGYVGASKGGGRSIAAALASVEDSAKNWIKVPGALEEVPVRTKAGIPTDADFDVARDGFIVVDTTNGAIWFRDGGSWVRAGVQSGTMVPWGGSGTPDGFLLCDGAAVSRTTYAKLFTAIGTAFGVGDGTTTFNLPDLVDKLVVGGAPGPGGGTISPAAALTTHGTHPTHAAHPFTAIGATGAVQAIPSSLTHDAHGAHDAHAIFKNVLVRWIIAI